MNNAAQNSLFQSPKSPNPCRITPSIYSKSRFQAYFHLIIQLSQPPKTDKFTPYYKGAAKMYPKTPIIRRNRQPIGFMTGRDVKTPNHNYLNLLVAVSRFTGLRLLTTVIGMAFAAMLIMGVAKQEIAGVLNIC